MSLIFDVTDLGVKKATNPWPRAGMHNVRPIRPMRPAMLCYFVSWVYSKKKNCLPAIRFELRTRGLEVRYEDPQCEAYKFEF